jgi:uncharacterized membrane protein
VYINNVGAILHSLAPEGVSTDSPELHAAQQLHVSLLSLLSFVSRILVGFLADYTHSFGVPYTFWAVVSSALMGFVFMLSLEVLLTNFRSQ